MTDARCIVPLLTATHRYDKSLSTRGRGHGEVIEAPILAYLIETRNGRILYDVGCDYHKIADPVLRARHYDPSVFVWGVPDMREEQRLPHHLARLGLTPLDIDVIFLGHLHFDHAGGLGDVRGPEVHVQRAELAAARERPGRRRLRRRARAAPASGGSTMANTRCRPASSPWPARGTRPGTCRSTSSRPGAAR